MNSKNFLNSIMALLGTGISYLFGGWDVVLKVVVIFISIDYITGVMVGFVNKELSSDIGFKGLMKKAAIFIIIIIAHQLDVTIGTDVPMFRTMACYFYIANEGLSVIENIVLLGVPLPKGLVDALKKLKDKIDSES